MTILLSAGCKLVEMPLVDGLVLRNQQLDFGARYLGRLGRRASIVEEEFVFKKIADFQLDPPTGLAGDAYRERLLLLPTSTLAALSKLGPSTCQLWGSNHRKFWVEALMRQRWCAEGYSPIGGAKLLATLLRDGAYGPAQLANIASAELGARGWDSEPNYREAMAELSNELSTITRPAIDHLKALQKFRGRLTLPRWTLVESVLLQMLLAWPSLLLGDGHCRLPVVLDVDFDNKGVANPPRATFINCAAWGESVAHCRAVAPTFWAYKHSSWPREFRDKIAKVSVSLDLTLAEAIVKPFVDLISAREPPSMNGKSFEAYVVAIVLGRFIDPRAMETTRITGAIGEKLENGYGEYVGREGNNYRLSPIEGEQEKAIAAVEEFVADRFISAKEGPYLSKAYFPGGISPGRARHPKGVAPATNRSQLLISQVQDLEELADAAFGQRWRRHGYWRAPELSSEFKRKTEDDEEKDSVIERLATNSGAFLTLNPSISAVAVARALKSLLNTLTKYARADERKRLRRREIAKSDVNEVASYERVANFSFLRVLPNEQGEKFGRVLWQALGGSREEFDKFRFDVSCNGPSEILARVLGNQYPTPAQPSRVPDVLVIVGSKHLGMEPQAGIAAGPFTRLRLHSIMENATDIPPMANEWLREFIPKTRIILVPEDWTISQSEDVTTQLEDDVANAFRRLSIFPNGFTYQMAQSLLKLSEERFHNVMSALTHTSYGKGDLLEYAETAAEYFLRARGGLPRDPEALAELHYDAANAISGFLEDGDTARFDFRQSLSPVRLHHAQYHLEQAIALGTATAIKAKAGLDRITRAGDLIGWFKVRWAMDQATGDTWDVLDAISQHIESRPESVHAIEYVLAARLAFKLERLANKSNARERADRCRSLRLRFLQSALQDDNVDVDGVEDRRAGQYVVATSAACQIMTEEPNQDGVQKAKQLMEAIQALAPGALEIIDPEWFEFLGDSKEDHAEAAEIYRRGFLNDELPGARGVRLPTMIKFFGASQLASVPVSKENLVTIESELGPGVLRMALTSNLDSGLHELSVVQRRFEAGKEQVQALVDRSQSAPQRGACVETARMELLMGRTYE